jgi:hypothetical protein
MKVNVSQSTCISSKGQSDSCVFGRPISIQNFHRWWMFPSQHILQRSISFLFPQLSLVDLYTEFPYYNSTKGECFPVNILQWSTWFQLFSQLSLVGLYAEFPYYNSTKCECFPVNISYKGQLESCFPVIFGILSEQLVDQASNNDMISHLPSA